MLNAFAATGNALSLIEDASVQPAIVDCFEMLPISIEDRAAAKEASSEGVIESKSIKWEKSLTLSEEIQSLLRDQEQLLRIKFGEKWRTPVRCFTMFSINIGGIQYKSHLTKTPGDSLIFFNSRFGEVVPGKIRRIFWVAFPLADKSVYGRAFFLEMQRFKHVTARDRVPNPFLDYPHFNAGVWSDELNPEIELIERGQLISHAVRQPWKRGTTVFKQLSRVSRFASF